MTEAASRGRRRGGDHRARLRRHALAVHRPLPPPSRGITRRRSGLPPIVVKVACKRWLPLVVQARAPTPDRERLERSPSGGRWAACAARAGAAAAPFAQHGCSV